MSDLAGPRSGDHVGPVFAALADANRRLMLRELLREGTTSVPELSAVLPITRQAVAKHLGTLDHAGLIERAPSPGREVRYRLRAGGLQPAAEWMREAEGAWEARLARLKRSLEQRPAAGAPTGARASAGRGAAR